MTNCRPASIPARWAALVLLAALAALCVRLVWIDERLREPPRRSGWRAHARLDAPLSKVAWLHDEQLYYLSTAVNALEGRGFFPDYNQVRDGIFVPPPLQSILILLVFRAAGGLVEPSTLLALQALAASLMVVLAAELGRRLASPAAGLACAFLTALHPDFVQWSGYLLTESNYLAGFSLLALLLARWAEAPTLARAVGAALVLGLLNLERPNAFWLPPLLALLALAFIGARRGLPAAAVFLLVPLTVLLPWRQRNVAVYGEPIWVSSNMGVYMYLANSPELDVLVTPHMDGANRGRRLLSAGIEARFRNPENGRLRVTYYQYSQAYSAAFRSYVRARPLHFARNYAAKLVAQFWLVPDSPPVCSRFGIPPAAYKGAQRVIVLLGLAGLAATLGWSPNRAAVACASLFGYFTLAGGLAGTDVAGRYTIVLRFLLVVFLATGLASGAARWRVARP
jgi:4-amino-4-deoxy-L-arabinose transferase-like glycosyltransferase